MYTVTSTRFYLAAPLGCLPVDAQMKCPGSESLSCVHLSVWVGQVTSDQDVTVESCTRMPLAFIRDYKLATSFPVAHLSTKL